MVCYLDSTVALPMLTHYALARHKKRRHKKLYAKLPKFMQELKQAYFAHNKK